MITTTYAFPISSVLNLFHYFSRIWGHDPTFQLLDGVLLVLELEQVFLEVILIIYAYLSVCLEMVC